MVENKDLKIIWVPHDINKQDIKYVESIINRNNISTSFINSFDDFFKSESRVKVINRVGILAQLYWLSRVAYIGGGFSSGVHNLMEPASAGVPTIFGPNYSDFNEAEEIIHNKAGFSVNSGSEIFDKIKLFLNNDELTIASSVSAKKLISNSSGATDKIVKQLIY